MSIATIPDLHALDLPELGLTLLHSTVDDLDLVEVVGAVLLPDSSLVIADKASPNLTFLHPDGSLRARVGREGEGPGEHSEISRIGLTSDGSLFAYDRALRRFTFLDRRARSATPHRISGPPSDSVARHCTMDVEAIASSARTTRWT